MAKTHGMSNTRIYRIYNGMLQRCKPNSTISPRIYSAKGITVCDEWRGNGGFSRFADWALSHGYADDLVCDRINPNKGYSADNCQWITLSENSAKAWVDTGRHVALKHYPYCLSHSEAVRAGYANALNSDERRVLYEALMAVFTKNPLDDDIVISLMSKIRRGVF